MPVVLGGRTVPDKTHDASLASGDADPMPGIRSGEQTRPHHFATLALGDFEFPMGNVQMVGKSSAPMYRGEKHIAKLAPLFALDEVAEHAVDFWLSAEDLPDPDNRVTLAQNGSIVLSYTPNNREPLEQLYHRVKRHLGHLGMNPHHLLPRDAYMKNDIPVAGCAHQSGTVRIGNDPATSVLDPDSNAHEQDNHNVVDTSFFPSIGAVNHALTAMANALRVGDHLLARLG